ncbi:hypothetical protein ACTWP5_03685 [Streptomyces sp. 4N509B]|uniref:hypothetical protein n=1 Tax=Streptomyces sp. 4N509B TaxID=3457413 RepID=UPI003FD2A979
MRRILAALSVGAVVATGALITAAPAQASTADCVGYLHDVGYTVGYEAASACEIAEFQLGGAVLCNALLQNLGVAERHAVNACTLGAS